MTTHLSIFKSHSFCKLICLCALLVGEPIRSITMHTDMGPRLNGFSYPSQSAMKTFGQKDSFPLRVGDGIQDFPEDFSSRNGQPLLICLESLLEDVKTISVLIVKKIRKTKKGLSQILNFRIPGKIISLRGDHRMKAIRGSEF